MYSPVALTFAEEKDYSLLVFLHLSICFGYKLSKFVTNYYFDWQYLSLINSILPFAFLITNDIVLVSGQVPHAHTHWNSDYVCYI